MPKKSKDLHLETMRRNKFAFMIEITMLPGRRCKQRYSFLVLALALVISEASMAAQQSPMAPAGQRGVKIANEPLSAHVGRRIVVAIGIDRYENWPRLKTAVSDAQGLQRLLIDKFAFQQIEPPLIDGAATRPAILSLVEDRLRTELKPDDDLIFFFAGHGTTRTDDVGGEQVDTGYLVPVQAAIPGTEEHWSDYIQTDELLEAIGKLPPKHILVILDSCESGFALGKAVQLTRGSPRFEADLASHRSRRVITSAGKKQPASDGGPVPNHSLFTGLLIQGLEWGKADIYGDGIVTSSQLGLYIQRAVGAASDSKQTPDFGSFYLDDRGELVLPLSDQTFTGIKSRAFGALRWAEYTTFRSLVAKVADLRPDAPETLYLQYRLAMLDRHIDDASQIIMKLIDMNVPEGQIPLSRDDLWNLKERLPYWKPVLLLPEKDFPATLQLEAGQDRKHMTQLTKISLGDTSAYFVAPGTPFRWQVTNNSTHQLFLYALAIDQDGRLFPFSPWEPGPILTTGLDPAASYATALFRQDGELEMQEFHFIAAPNQIYGLLSPVSSATRGLSSLDTKDLLSATQKIEHYSTMDISTHQEAVTK